MAQIDNTIYETLGERWYEAWDDPVALLRAENKLKQPWISERIRQEFGTTPAKILDVGCGAGFLTNVLSAEGHSVIGIDSSRESLRIAKLHDSTRSVEYVEADALHLPFADASFDVVTCLDFLEHVHTPGAYITEMARVLKPGGLFFFHTFNRNLLAWLVVIKGVEIFVKNTPKHMHVIDLFITPRELKGYCQRAGLEVREMTGLRPVIGSIPWRNWFLRTVPEGLRFELTGFLGMSYLGFAKKHKFQ